MQGRLAIYCIKLGGLTTDTSYIYYTTGIIYSDQDHLYSPAIADIYYNITYIKLNHISNNHSISLCTLINWYIQLLQFIESSLYIIHFSLVCWLPTVLHCIRETVSPLKYKYIAYEVSGAIGLSTYDVIKLCFWNDTITSTISRACITLHLTDVIRPLLDQFYLHTRVLYSCSHMEIAIAEPMMYLCLSFA